MANPSSPPQIVDTTRYLAPGAGARTYRLVSGPDAGKSERHQPTLLKREAGTTTWRYDAGGKFNLFIIARADGNYYMTGVTDKEEGAITKYSPLEPFMLQGLAPGEERQVKMGVKIFDLSSPDEHTHAGSLDVNYLTWVPIGSRCQREASMRFSSSGYSREKSGPRPSMIASTGFSLRMSAWWQGSRSWMSRPFSFTTTTKSLEGPGQQAQITGDQSCFQYRVGKNPQPSQAGQGIRTAREI